MFDLIDSYTTLCVCVCTHNKEVHIHPELPWNSTKSDHRATEKESIQFWNMETAFETCSQTVNTQGLLAILNVAPATTLRAILFFSNYLFIFREGGRREEGRETSMWEWNSYRLPLARAPAGDWTCNPGTCPDWESNWWPFTLWNDTQRTEPHWSGQEGYSYCYSHDVIVITAIIPIFTDVKSQGRERLHFMPVVTQSVNSKTENLQVVEIWSVCS